MGSNSVASLASALSQVSVTDHEEILQLATSALQSNPHNSSFQHARLVSLLNLDRYDDVVRSVEDSGDVFADKFVLEYAYALYRTNRLDDAIRALQSSSKSSNVDRGFAHLEAQISYRQEKFREAYQLYKELGDSQMHLGESQDLLINNLAVITQLAWQDNIEIDVHEDKIKEDIESSSTFEILYNTACMAIAQKSYKKAFILLHQARRLCEESDELSDDEKLFESVPIMVQQIAVFTRLDMHEEARKLQQSLQRLEQVEADVQITSSINGAILDTIHETNPYRREMKIDVKLRDALNPKSIQNTRINCAQQNVLKQLQLILGLESFKLDGLAGRIPKIASSSPLLSENKGYASLANLAVRARDNITLTTATSLLRQCPGDVGLLLYVLQGTVAEGRYVAALTYVDEFIRHVEQSSDDDLLRTRHSPALVALIVTLYLIDNRKAQIDLELKKSATFWSSQADIGSSSILALHSNALVSFLQSHNPDDLALVQTLAHKVEQSSTPHYQHISKIALQSVEFDPDTEIDLPDSVELIGDIDATKLLQAGVAPLPSRSVALSNTKKSTGDSQDKEAAPAKRRRRIPAGIDKTKTPDPERWLPLRDRSSYKPKGKKARRLQADATQGGPVKPEIAPSQPAKATPAVSAEKKKKKGKK